MKKHIFLCTLLVSFTLTSYASYYAEDGFEEAGFDNFDSEQDSTTNVGDSNDTKQAPKAIEYTEEQLRAAQDTLFEGISNPTSQKSYDEKAVKIINSKPGLLDALKNAADVLNNKTKLKSDKISKFQKSLRDANMPSDLIKLINKNSDLDAKERSVETKLIKRYALKNMMAKIDRGNLNTLADLKSISPKDLAAANIDSDIKLKINEMKSLQINKRTGSIDRSQVPMSEEERQEKQRKDDELAEAREAAERDYHSTHER